MTIYADFEFYQQTYKGIMDNSSFEIYSIKASLEMKNATRDRATITEEAQYCMCELVDTIKRIENSRGKTSEKVLSHNVNYDTNLSYEREIRKIIVKHLRLTGWLHEGV